MTKLVLLKLMKSLKRTLFSLFFLSFYPSLNHSINCLCSNTIFQFLSAIPLTHTHSLFFFSLTLSMKLSYNFFPSLHWLPSTFSSFPFHFYGSKGTFTFHLSFLFSSLSSTTFLHYHSSTRYLPISRLLFYHIPSLHISRFFLLHTCFHFHFFIHFAPSNRISFLFVF